MEGEGGDWAATTLVFFSRLAELDFPKNDVPAGGDPGLPVPSDDKLLDRWGRNEPGIGIGVAITSLCLRLHKLLWNIPEFIV